MRQSILLLLAGASVATLATAANAQTAQPAAPAAAPAAEEATLGEIVVTARRRTESLQEVPQTVNAVTSEALQKLNIRQFQDIQSVVPGLSLATTASGFQNSASLRGISFEVNTGAQPTVAFYLNDAPLQLSFVFQSLFDLGQVEVLKGPQGTTRGISAPSGAITITTRKPDLGAYGGYIDVTGTDQHGRNVQGAINIPIIKDVLAVRVAGLLDVNDQNDVGSIHNGTHPRGRTDAIRTSVSFEPSDKFNANVTYQHLDNDLTNFTQVTGPGPGAFTVGDTFYPASVNPPLSIKDRAAVMDLVNDTQTFQDLVTLQLDSRLFGQHFSYVGSYTHFKVKGEQESGNPSAGDSGNLLPGVGIFQVIQSAQKETTQEFRVSSDPAPGRFFDYTVGAFYHWVNPTGHILNPGPLAPGAFGSPAGPIDLAAYNPSFQIPIAIDLPSTYQETSLFGNVTFHLGENTELSGGIRHMWAVTNNRTQISTLDGKLAVAAAAFGGNCGALGFASTYPGFCDLPLAGGPPGNAGGTPVSGIHSSSTPNIYNVSLSHHFSRDFLVYADTGTAFRPPTSSVGVQGQLSSFILPDGDNFSVHPAERSRSYEVGFKSTWLDGRARLNASIFTQTYTNFTLYVPNISINNVLPGLTPSPAPVLADGTAAPAGTFVPTTFSLTKSVNAKVTGFDVDGAFQVTPEWNISAQFSYADGRVTSGDVPCNLGTSEVPIYNTGNLVSLCPGGSASRLPYWNATVQSEYNRPVAENMDGFLRVLATIYPQNKDRVEQNFTVGNYSLLNLYGGVRSHDGAWEVSVFARNVLNVQTATDISTQQANINASLATFFPQLIRPTGYFETTTTNPREVGVNVHYAWGSR
jgi:iron complex outermembrane receptor protein